MTKKSSPSEVEAIFHKAASLDLQLKEALSLEQLKEIAFESGISLEALELAIEEVTAPQQLNLRLKRESSSNLEAHPAKQNLSLHNQSYSLLIYAISAFVAGRLGLLTLHYFVNTQAYFLDKISSYKYLLRIIAYFLEFNLELITVLAALYFPLALVFWLFKINLAKTDHLT